MTFFDLLKKTWIFLILLNQNNFLTQSLYATHHNLTVQLNHTNPNWTKIYLYIDTNPSTQAHGSPFSYDEP